MKIVIPMAGSGQRFVDAGYDRPKPLIEILGPDGTRRSIIAHVLDAFDDPADEFVFVCNQRHLDETDMRAKLAALRPGATIVAMPCHKLGPVHTVLAARDHILPQEPVLVAYCDTTLGRSWGRREFEAHVAREDLHGCLLTHIGFHPHALSRTTKMAFVRLGNQGFVTAVKEKASYTATPSAEHASSGVYYFNRGDTLTRACDNLIRNPKAGHNGEFYITLAYNVIIQYSMRVGYFDTPHVAILGTPEEVRNYEAWATILGGAQVRTPMDLLEAQRYWKEYHER